MWECKVVVRVWREREDDRNGNGNREVGMEEKSRGGVDII